jgi:hypothetical protein
MPFSQPDLPFDTERPVVHLHVSVPVSAKKTNLPFPHLVHLEQREKRPTQRMSDEDLTEIQRSPGSKSKRKREERKQAGATKAEKKTDAAKSKDSKSAKHDDKEKKEQDGKQDGKQAAPASTKQSRRRSKNGHARGAPSSAGTARPAALSIDAELRALRHRALTEAELADVLATQGRVGASYGSQCYYYTPLAVEKKVNVRPVEKAMRYWEAFTASASASASTAVSASITATDHLDADARDSVAWHLRFQDATALLSEGPATLVFSYLGLDPYRTAPVPFDHPLHTFFPAANTCACTESTLCSQCRASFSGVRRCLRCVKQQLCDCSVLDQLRDFGLYARMAFHGERIANRLEFASGRTLDLRIAHASVSGLVTRAHTRLREQILLLLAYFTLQLGILELSRPVAAAPAAPMAAAAARALGETRLATPAALAERSAAGPRGYTELQKKLFSESKFVLSCIRARETITEYLEPLQRYGTRGDTHADPSPLLQLLALYTRLEHAYARIDLEAKGALDPLHCAQWRQLSVHWAQRRNSMLAGCSRCRTIVDFRHVCVCVDPDAPRLLAYGPGTLPGRSVPVVTGEVARAIEEYRARRARHPVPAAGPAAVPAAGPSRALPPPPPVLARPDAWRLVVASDDELRQLAPTTASLRYRPAPELCALLEQMLRELSAPVVVAAPGPGIGPGAGAGPGAAVPGGRILSLANDLASGIRKVSTAYKRGMDRRADETGVAKQLMEQLQVLTQRGPAAEFERLVRLVPHLRFCRWPVTPVDEEARVVACAFVPPPLEPSDPLLCLDADEKEEGEWTG